ncbi:MAG: FMN-binding protein [Brevinematales bacterium]|nr:FMN-binding protein [Brevinematales bacterium]
MNVVLIVLGIIAGLVGLGFIALTWGMKTIKDMPINDVDLSKLKDGVYKGEFNKGRWNYIVEVTVKGGRVTGITNVKAQYEELEKFSQDMTKTIIEQQKVNIDALSAATIDSKAFLKAVENALTINK